MLKDRQLLLQEEDPKDLLRLLVQQSLLLCQGCLLYFESLYLEGPQDYQRLR